MPVSLERALLLLVKVLTAFLVCAGFYFFIRYLWPLLEQTLQTLLSVCLPIILACLVGTVLQPVVNLLQVRFRLSRTWGSLLVLLVFLGAIGTVVYLLVAELIKELLELSLQLASLSQSVDTGRINLLLDRLRSFLVGLHLPASSVQEVLSGFRGILDLLKNLSQLLLKELFYLFSSLPGYLVLLMITVVASYFVTRDYHLIRRGIIRLLPDKWRERVMRTAASLRLALFGYLKAEIILISITGMESLIGLNVLGVKYAHLLAILVALFDLLPVLGPGTFYLPWSVWMFITGNVRMGIGLLILYGIIIVVRQLLEPKVVGESIGLHPLTTLIALYLGLSLLGIWGLILGPASVIAYKAFFQQQKAGS